MKPAITIHDLSKKYTLQQGTPYVALRDVISNGFKNAFSKNEKRSQFWALKDINLEVGPGERIGIIGANGAGKSTLLKIISRITPPSSGKIILNGRVASLLEVGTGFHPELTGRENIYLNGSILGLTKKEIDKKFDEIIDFSGVESFIDTPMKHFSTGMQLRLAFSVAAHLEPEILLIDEVLAVGDMEFQKKCMGKMEEISTQSGRTILFVSHNLASIGSLCNKAILLEEGKIVLADSAKRVIEQYTSDIADSSPEIYKAYKDQKLPLFFSKIYFADNNNKQKNIFNLDEEIILNFELDNNGWNSICTIGFAINDQFGKRLLRDEKEVDCRNLSGTIKGKIIVPKGMLTPHVYFIDLSILNKNIEVIQILKGFMKFEILISNTKYEFINYDYGVINKGCTWFI